MQLNKTKHNFETCLNEPVNVLNFKCRKNRQPDVFNFHEMLTFFVLCPGLLNIFLLVLIF